MKWYHYFTLASLPPLGEMGSKPPLETEKLIEILAIETGISTQVEALCLLDDLTQRQAFMVGEIDKVKPCVLTSRQVRNDDPLPDFLVPESVDEALVVDRVWNSFFHYAEEVGGKYANSFLSAWVRHEVSLRNVLVRARAAQIGFDPHDYLVAPDLDEKDCDLDDLSSRWTAAPDPLTGWSIVMTNRWDWTSQHGPWFSFSDDEITSYAAKLNLLHQWHRVFGSRPAHASVMDGTETSEQSTIGSASL